jgi:hypothetical protein
MLIPFVGSGDVSTTTTIAPPPSSSQTTGLWQPLEFNRWKIFYIDTIE